MLSEDRLPDLPDVALVEMLLNTPFPELSYVCINNPLFYSICTSNYFWEQKTFNDFGEDIENPENLPWSEIYQRELAKSDIRRARYFKLVDDFNNVINAELNGEPPNKIYDLTNFNIEKFTGARLISRPRAGLTTGRSQFTMPRIVIDGRQIQIPIGAQPRGQFNFENFVRLVVGKSNYRQLVEPIIQAFNQQIPQQQ